MGVETLGAEGAVDPVELAGDGVPGSELPLFVDQGVQLLALRRIDLCEVLLVESCDAVEMNPLGLVVESAEPGGPLEQHVFEVVGDPRRYRRVVLAARPDDDLGVEPRFLIVLAEIDGEAVLQPVHLNGHGIGRVRCMNQRGLGPGGGGDGEDGRDPPCPGEEAGHGDSLR